MKYLILILAFMFSACNPLGKEYRLIEGANDKDQRLEVYLDNFWHLPYRHVSDWPPYLKMTVVTSGPDVVCYRSGDMAEIQATQNFLDTSSDLRKETLMYREIARCTITRGSNNAVISGGGYSASLQGLPKSLMNDTPIYDTLNTLGRTDPEIRQLLDSYYYQELFLYNVMN